MDALSSAFVQVEGQQFVKNGKPYYFLGTNFWSALHLAVQHRDRLLKELDQLKALGLQNLRIMAAFEGPDEQPWRAVPSLQPQPGVYRQAFLQGLDYLLVAMGEREMNAVICLNNFWPWSGGMAQYVAWMEGISIPYPPPAPRGSWRRYAFFASRFYRSQAAMACYWEFVEMLLRRSNSLNGLAYRDDPTIMAWQLANEPRGMFRARAYRRWLSQTAQLIKSLAPRQLVSLGSEGDTATPFSGTHPLKDHADPHIDYLTCHIWVQNWGWFDPKRGEASYLAAEKKALAYLHKHQAYARQLNKPLVLEEFGISRDQGAYGPETAVSLRDRYYQRMFREVGRENGLAGANFWAWAGAGRPREAGGLWQPGDDWIGDPPHEHQGWYSVYDRDASTLEVLKNSGRADNFET
jgi:mannan endo-1,4-beta-mannosidase